MPILRTSIRLLAAFPLFLPFAVPVPAASQSSPVAESIPITITIGQLVMSKIPPDYDKNVLEPLYKAQKQLAIRIAQEQAEIARKVQEEQEAAEKAYQIDIDATISRLQPFGTYQNNYAFGNCTAYVSSRVNVPGYMGNASSWSWGLIDAGWRQGPPRRGAIGVSHNGWAGHVVISEKTNGGTVLISEMNYQGFNIISERWVEPEEFEWFYQ